MILLCNHVNLQKRRQKGNRDIRFSTLQWKYECQGTNSNHTLVLHNNKGIKHFNNMSWFPWAFQVFSVFPQNQLTNIFAKQWPCVSIYLRYHLFDDL